MKLSLTEISLKELREFIGIADSYSNIGLSELSLVSLKLRIQLLIKKYQLSDFTQFQLFYNADIEFREKIHNEIIPLPNELFRDADNWVLLIEQIKSHENNKEIKIAVCEAGKCVDVISLIILLINELPNLNYTIDVYALRKQYQHINLKFDIKEFELAETNYARFNPTKNLKEYFIETNKQFEFIVPNNINYKTIPSFETNLLSQDKYNIVIARNLTISYNFKTHEDIFSKLTNMLNKNALLFTGNKESFKWCANYNDVNCPNSDVPIYYKK